GAGDRAATNRVAMAPTGIPPDLASSPSAPDRNDRPHPRGGQQQPTLGAERIRRELLKVGIRVSKRTIQKYMRPHRRHGAVINRPVTTALASIILGPASHDREARMTYRDDHDAALARAESLEAELANVERERDRLRAELDKAKHPAPAAPAPAAPAP